MRPVRIAALALAGLALAALVGAGRPDGARAVDEQPAQGITVTGTGTASAAPDRASFSFGVASVGTTAQQALAANAAETAKVVSALKEAGVARADLQTQEVSLSAQPGESGAGIAGFLAQNSISVTIRHLSRAGALVDAAVAAGASQVFGPSLSASDQAALSRQALRAAAADARAKAEAIAAATGMTLGKVLSAVEGGPTPVPLPLAARAGVAGMPQTPIEPGTQQIQATVTVTFAIA